METDLAPPPAGAPPAPAGRGGFSLIEVLIAMVVLAVGLLALESLAIGASRSIATANRMTEYTLIASQRLETVQERVRSGLAAPSGVEVLANGTTVQTVVQQNVQAGSLWTITVTVTPPSRGVGNALLTPTTVTGLVSTQ